MSSIIDQILAKYPPLLTIDQLAEIMNFSAKTLRNWISSSECPFPLQRLGRRAVRVQALHLAKWIDSGGSPVPQIRKKGRPRMVMSPEKKALTCALRVDRRPCISHRIVVE